MVAEYKVVMNSVQVPFMAEARHMRLLYPPAFSDPWGLTHEALVSHRPSMLLLIQARTIQLYYPKEFIYTGHHLTSDEKEK